MEGSQANHYFSLRSRISNSSRQRDSGFPVRLTLPTVAPGPTSGALRFVSLALHIPSHKGEGRRRNVSARNISEPSCRPETLFSSLAPLRAFAHTDAKTHRAQQAWMNSRNQTTIATAFTHRQHTFLHPTLGGKVRLHQQAPSPRMLEENGPSWSMRSCFPVVSEEQLDSERVESDISNHEILRFAQDFSWLRCPQNASAC